MELITAREAFDKGLKRYFTDLPCKHGHVAERMVANGSCAECMRLRDLAYRAKNPGKNYEKVKEWRAANPGARTEEARKYRAKHPDKVAERTQRYREKNADRVRELDAAAHRRMRLINPEAEKARLAAFEARKEAKRVAEAGRPRADVCELCSAPGRTVFDHCHTNGHFRGWLCDRCNRTLGQVKDDPALLRAMANYLEERNGNPNGENSQSDSNITICLTGPEIPCT